MQWFHINKNCNALASNGIFYKNQRPSNQAGSTQDTRLYILSLSQTRLAVIFYFLLCLKGNKTSVITSVLSYFTHSFIVNVS